MAITIDSTLAELFIYDALFNITIDTHAWCSDEIEYGKRMTQWVMRWIDQAQANLLGENNILNGFLNNSRMILVFDSGIDQ